MGSESGTSMAKDDIDYAINRGAGIFINCLLFRVLWFFAFILLIMIAQFAGAYINKKQAEGLPECRFGPDGITYVQTPCVQLPGHSYKPDFKKNNPNFNGSGGNPNIAGDATGTGGHY